MIGSPSSLAFRSVLKSAASRAGLDRSPDRLTGLTPAAVAFHAAVMAHERPIALVVPTDSDVAQIPADARFFLTVLEGGSEHDVMHQVLPYPSQEVDPYRGLSPHLEVASTRARALYALATGTARLVILSARALLPRLSDV